MKAGPAAILAAAFLAAAGHGWAATPAIGEALSVEAETTPAASATTLAASSTITGAVAVSSTLAAAAAPSATTLRAAPAPSATAGPSLSATVSGAAAGATKVVEPSPSIFEELHKKTTVGMLPSAYAAHIGRETGENARIFLAWYIGTLYNEEGLFIAPIFSLLAGLDGKWAFLGERRYRPAAAFGYLGGLTVPFTGGAVRTSVASTAAGVESEIKQTWINNLYLVMGKRVGPVRLSVGGMRGLSKAFAELFPMLRNSSYSTIANPPSDLLWLAYGGLDLTWRKRHYKLEVMTLPEKIEPAYAGDEAVRPWLVHTHFDGLLGFEMAYLKDRVGYEIIGYYMLPFARWPNKKRLDKEIERAKADRTGAIYAP